MVLTVENLSAGYGSDPDVLSSASLDVERGEVVALLGASGSGKSTLLRCVAGLHPVRDGRITVAQRDVRDVKVEQRGVGLVFQDHALFPHRDVAGNVAFGPRMQQLEGDAVTDRVTKALEDVGLAQLARRSVDELSGGEQQRVALARALAARPQLLLLDEPYGSLDRPLRERLASELPALVRREGIGALLVTHDQQEALRAADRIAIIVEGTIRQFDRPERVWRDPHDATVAAFLGIGPLLDAEIRHGVACGDLSTIPVPQRPDGRAVVLVPHRACRLPGDSTETSGHVRMRAKVIDVRFAGDHHRVEASIGPNASVSVRVESAASLPQRDEVISLTVDPAEVRVFSAPETFGS